MQRMLAGQIPALRRYARALTGDHEAADDLVQESLERAWRKSGHWKSELPLRPWLFTLMHNVYVNGIRKKRPVVLDDPPDDIVDPVRSGPQRAMDLRDLEKGLAQLPDPQREVLLLVCLEEMRYEEVARVLDVPVGTVMSRLHRARKSLRTIMNQGLHPAQPTVIRTDNGPTIRRVK
jgi:RNA polymerase sigma-70 factor (ECF subfamily)